MLRLILLILLASPPLKCDETLQHYFNQLLLDNKLDVDTSGVDEDINGAGLCSMLAGCKILNGRKGCYGPSGTNECAKCQHVGRVHKRNVMRADFYDYNEEELHECGQGTGKCPNQFPFIKDMLDNMVLKGDEIARTPQGSIFQGAEYSVPDMQLHHYYSVYKFCGPDCYETLRHACLFVTLLPHIRHWCLTSLALIKDDLNELYGPSSYILFLAARLVDPTNKLEVESKKIKCIKRKGETKYDVIDCVWPKIAIRAEFEEKATLVAAAASSVLLLGNWFINKSETIVPPFGQFGYAVHHSIWLAIFMGRLRITLHHLPAEYKETEYIVPGTQTLCGSEDVKVADNYEGGTGTAYASLCTLFRQQPPGKPIRNPTMRYRPEIHTRNAMGCVERTTGMIFIRPGDWITNTPKASVLGSSFTPLGILFYDQKEHLTTIEISRSRTIMYPPSIAVALKVKTHTVCEEAEGNGPNDGFSQAGLSNIGGLCNWVPVW